MHVCFVATEAVPFAKVGGLADVIGALPAALRALGHRVTVLLPFHGGIDPRARSLARRLSPVPVTLGPASWPFEVWEARLGTGVDVVLLRQPALFEQLPIYTGGPADPPRYAAFCRAALEVLAERGTPVDVLHAHDWPAALAPYYLARGLRERPALAGTRVLLTIHNIAHQPLVEAGELGRLDLRPADFHPGGFEFYGRISPLKAGVLWSDRVTTVSPSYAAELLTPEGGHGLDGVLRALPRPVVGILNALDPQVWNPFTDPHLPHAFSADALEGKAGCKLALQRRLGLEPRPEATLAAVVARLAPQKGIDLVAAVVPQLAAADVQLVVVGDGDAPLREELERLSAAEPGRVRLVTGFEEPTARLAYAGSDLFLVPSRYEPCGLTQLIAMRYGSVPVARRTGGLADTVLDVDARLETGTGFTFDPVDPDALLGAVQRAVAARADRPAWARLVRRLMRLDHSWDVAARQYDELYRTLGD
ncbi:MAG: glycogen synthase [Deltaproteobacteria bacterium]|nr:glycogen synthase [Deltaproteobacteria bacterium]